MTTQTAVMPFDNVVFAPQADSQPRHLAIFKIKHVYGNPLSYPVNGAAVALCTLIGAKTWIDTPRNRQAVAALGIVLEIND